MKLFSKNLTATDCLKRLSIPSRVLTSLPQFHRGHAVKLRVMFETVVWPLVCTIRRKGPYKKPVISKGWRKFVIGNGLNVGDRLTFHMEEEEEEIEGDESSRSLHYRVELKRATKPTKTLDVNEKTISETLEQFDLSKSVGADEVVDSDGQVSECAKEETAASVVEQFNLGLTVDGGTVVHVHDDQGPSFFKTDDHQRVGFDLGSVLGQSMHGSVLNLDLTLGHQY